jgi:hypothetical protein
MERAVYYSRQRQPEERDRRLARSSSKTITGQGFCRTTSHTKEFVVKTRVGVFPRARGRLVDKSRLA